jgi:ABC-type Fe3+ transport system substrate-binding protein
VAGADDDPLKRGFEQAFATHQARLGTWLRRCEAGLDAPMTTTPELTMALFDTGPSLYDGVVTYEHLALPLLDRVDSHADALRKLIVLYPNPTLLARHPAVLFDAPPDKQAAARRWLHFLLTKEMQEKAIDTGFRPVTPAVTIDTYDEDSNPFLRLRRYGVLVQPHLTEAPRPDGSDVQKLINLWGEQTGRN